MAVPKRKTTPSRRNQRRGGNGSFRSPLPMVIENKTSGGYQLPHHISEDGYYGDKQVVAPKVKKEKHQGEDGE